MQFTYHVVANRYTKFGKVHKTPFVIAGFNVEPYAQDFLDAYIRRTGKEYCQKHNVRIVRTSKFQGD